MRALTLNRGGHLGVQSPSALGAGLRGREAPALQAAWAVLLAVCLLAGAAAAHAQANQANQSENPSKSTAQQNPRAQGQATSPQAAASPQAASSSAAGPMVLGENPDSGDSAGTPTQPAPSPALQPAASPTSGALVPWNPANPPGESPAGSPVIAAAAPSEALPVPPPANAGGDSARQQINNQCVDLLEMANALKSAVDMTNQNILSVAVVRKADEIEVLAHHMKDEMRPEADKK